MVPTGPILIGATWENGRILIDDRDVSAWVPTSAVAVIVTSTSAMTISAAGRVTSLWGEVYASDVRWAQLLLTDYATAEMDRAEQLGNDRSWSKRADTVGDRPQQAARARDVANRCRDLIIALNATTLGIDVASSGARGLWDIAALHQRCRYPVRGIEYPSQGPVQCRLALSACVALVVIADVHAVQVHLLPSSEDTIGAVRAAILESSSTDVHVSVPPPVSRAPAEALASSCVRVLVSLPPGSTAHVRSTASGLLLRGRMAELEYVGYASVCDVEHVDRSSIEAYGGSLALDRVGRVEAMGVSTDMYFEHVQEFAGGARKGSVAIAALHGHAELDTTRTSVAVHAVAPVAVSGAVRDGPLALSSESTFRVDTTRLTIPDDRSGHEA